MGDADDIVMAQAFRDPGSEPEALDRRRLTSQAEAKMAIFDWLERWYYPTRRHSSLGYRSPIDYERHALEHERLEPLRVKHRAGQFWRLLITGTLKISARRWNMTTSLLSFLGLREEIVVFETKKKQNPSKPSDRLLNLPAVDAYLRQIGKEDRALPA